MGLFNSSTKISFSEPWFFMIRIRTFPDWIVRIGIALTIGFLVFVAIYYWGNAPFDVLKQVGIALLVAFALLLMADKGNLQREMTVSDKDIHIHSASGNWWNETFTFGVIVAIELKRPAESRYKFGLMLIDHGDETFMLGVPLKVSLDTLANVLYRQDLAVALTDWEPPAGDTQVLDDLEIDPDQAVGMISPIDLEGVEPKLVTPVQMGLQLIVGVGPLLIGLIGLIWSGVHLYRNWEELDIAKRCLIGGAGFGGFILGFIYLLQIGQFICNGLAIYTGRKAMQRRVEPLFSGTEDDLMAVELYGPEKWTRIGMADDFGFLQCDRTTRLLKYEGSTTRWTMPFTALKSCRIQEGIMGGEGNENAEKKYFIVLSAAQEEAEEDWEFGFIYVRTEIGSDSYEKRYERSKLLFTQLADAMGV